MPGADVRARINAARSGQIAAWTLNLVQAASPNPPGDTGAAAETAAAILRSAIPDAEVTLHAVSDGVVNLVARVRGAGPGRRVVFNGHLDTYPVGDTAAWTRDPGGELVDGRIYGRGSADMKGGIAASIAALVALAAYRDAWNGEAVLTHASALGFRVVTADDLLRRGFAQAMAEFRDQVAGRPVYLCWDMDVFDPSVAPGVCTPTWGGLSAREGIDLMRTLTGLAIVAADFNTISPPHDVHGMAAHLCAHMMMEAMVLLARNAGHLR